MNNIFDEYGKTAEGKKSPLRIGYEREVIAKRPHLAGSISTIKTAELVDIINHEAENRESVIKHSLALALDRLEECLTMQGLEAIKHQYPMLKDNKAFVTACGICEKNLKLTL